jgi:hypothetical protein
VHGSSSRVSPKVVRKNSLILAVDGQDEPILQKKKLPYREDLSTTSHSFTGCTPRKPRGRLSHCRHPRFVYLS